MMILLAFVAALLWIGGLFALLRGFRQGVYRLSTPAERPDTGELETRVRDLEWLVDNLPQKWEEMAARAKRSEDRARAVVRRAQEELSAAGYEHAGVDAEATELRIVHGGGGEEAGVPAVQPSVAPAGDVGGPEEWEDVTRRRKYGR